MTSFKVFVSMCIAVALAAMSSASGPCDTIQNQDWPGIGVNKICFMQSAVIDSNDFMITSPRDGTVKGFSASGNKKLRYLPRNIGEKFPNLIILEASSCSLKEITEEKFKGLGKLRTLNLQNNRIEKIATFDGIPAVEKIFLVGNKIKKLNGRAFDSLNNLEYVDLRGNDCINEFFSSPSRIAGMSQIVTSKCGFTEAPKLNSKSCGMLKKATPTIMIGEDFDRGDFPWMVALYRRMKRKTQFDYFCGGSVISDCHVLTAAHCLKDLAPSDIFVVFGAYNLDDRYEYDNGRFARTPSRIFVHEEWDAQTTQFDADIAMLRMPQKIVFSTFVQPICLWDPQNVPTTTRGVIAGWGQSQNKSRDFETIPTKLQLPIHANDDCFLAFPHLAQVSSKRTFCAGSADGRGPCHGDSGGGFYVSVGNVSFLKGIVSAAWDVNIYGECLLKMFTIYTDVVQYKDWIDETMQRK